MVPSFLPEINPFYNDDIKDNESARRKAGKNSDNNEEVKEIKEEKINKEGISSKYKNENEKEDDSENKDENEDKISEDTRDKAEYLSNINNGLYVSSYPRSPSSSWMTRLHSKTTTLIAGTYDMYVQCDMMARYSVI